MHDFTEVLSPGCICQTWGQKTHCEVQRGLGGGPDTERARVEAAARREGPRGHRAEAPLWPGFGERRPRAPSWTRPCRSRACPAPWAGSSYFSPSRRPPPLSAKIQGRKRRRLRRRTRRGHGHGHRQFPRHREVRFRQHGSARAAANERRHRKPACAWLWPRGPRGPPLLRRLGRAALMRRRAALQPRAGSCEAAHLPRRRGWAAGVGQKGWAGLPPSLPFPLGKIDLQRFSSAFSSEIAPLRYAWPEVGPLVLRPVFQVGRITGRILHLPVRGHCCWWALTPLWRPPPLASAPTEKCSVSSTGLRYWELIEKNVVS